MMTYFVQCHLPLCIKPIATLFLYLFITTAYFDSFNSCIKNVLIWSVPDPVTAKSGIKLSLPLRKQRMAGIPFTWRLVLKLA